VFKLGGSKEERKKSKIMKCKTAYKDKLENLFKDKDSRKTITGFKLKRQCRTVENDLAFANDCRFDL
jgi:hypothetical protein